MYSHLNNVQFAFRIKTTANIFGLLAGMNKSLIILNVKRGKHLEKQQKK